MHFACTQENLVQGLGMVSHISGKNLHLPVLGNVLLKTEAGSLKLSTTNLELAVNCLVRGKVEQEGEYSVPAKLLLDFVSLLPSGKVELVLTDEGLEIRSSEQETVMKGMLATEFPVLPKLAQQNPFELPVADLRRAIGQVAFAVTASESRPELMGVATFVNGVAGEGKVAFASTDSYRLAERLVALKSGSGEGRYIIPAKSLIEVSRILAAYRDELTMPESAVFAFTDNQMVMNFGNVELVSRLIEGSFPDYRALIPSQFKTEATLQRSELLKAVRTASLFSRAGIFDVHLIFDPVASTCTVQSADQGTGKTKTIIKGVVTGEPNQVVLNYRYFADGLNAISSEKIVMKQIDAMNPLLVIPEGSTEAYQYIVMPIRQ